MANTDTNPSQSTGMTQPTDFVIDLPAIRQRARENLSHGAVTANYQADRQAMLRLLNDALATELVCYLPTSAISS